MITFRKATLEDVEGIVEMIGHYAKEGLMLPRTRSSLYEGIWEFTVATVPAEPAEAENASEVIVGIGGLHIIWSDLAEIRSLAVNTAYARQGIGRTLVHILLDEARKLKCPKVFTLTYQVEFFEKLGFQLTKKEDMPHKVWKECLNCVKFPNCDENAMTLTLRES